MNACFFVKENLFKISSLLLLLILPNAYAAIDPDNNANPLSGYLLDKTAISIQNNDLSLQRNELYLQYDSQTNPKIDIGIRDRYQWYLTPNPEYDIEFRTLTIGQNFDKWSWSFGRQLITWGKADGFRLLDTVNPYDYTEFVLDDINSAKIPLTMLQTNYFFNNSSLQLLIIPEYQGDKLPPPGSQFYLQQPELLQVDADKKIQPQTFPMSNWEYGLKWEYTGEDISYTLNYFYKWSNQSIIQFDPTTMETIAQPVREQVIGGSIDYPWSTYVLRNEFIFTPKKEMPILNNYSMLQYETYVSAATIFGVDDAINNWFFSVQYFLTKFMGGSSVAPIGGRTQQIYTYLMTYNFAEDILKFRLFTAYDETNKGNWFEPSLTWDMGKGIESTLGFDVFTGSQKSFFGQFSSRDRVYLLLKWSF